MVAKSCGNCLHKEICKFYAGALLTLDYWHKDYAVEVEMLKRKLGSECNHYERR